ncbi:hypothetical protein [Salipiger mucosus]|uniref:hypothetical protein n=1 Tax=Salipiger mucosus TaxID=263378 RepID=UPI001FE1BBDA|nr:hypothetical protein [Salipiger mucosus]
MRSDTLSIKCPKCGGCADFLEPFKFTNGIRADDLPENFKRWGRLIVEELFPDHFAWVDPEISKPRFLQSTDDDGPGYRLNHRGMLDCKKCDSFEKVAIDWPLDAYWRWNIKGFELLARNREHALEILSYLRERPRPPLRTPGLKHIPTPLLQEKHAVEVSAQMAQDLMAA